LEQLRKTKEVCNNNMNSYVFAGRMP